MAAPTPASMRAIPTAWKIDQGFKIITMFSCKPAVNFWEISVAPLSIDGGEEINTSTQYNTDGNHTGRPRALKKWKGGKSKVQIAAGTVDEVKDMVNVECTVTQFYPDGSTYCFHGYLKSIEVKSQRLISRRCARIGMLPTASNPSLSSPQRLERQVNQSTILNKRVLPWARMPFISLTEIQERKSWTM